MEVTDAESSKDNASPRRTLSHQPWEGANVPSNIGGTWHLGGAWAMDQEVRSSPRSDALPGVGRVT